MSRELKEAIERNDPKLVREALKAVNDVNRKLPGAARPLEYACKTGADAVIEILLKAGAKTRADSHPGGVLGVAAQSQRVKVIAALARFAQFTPHEIDWTVNESVLEARAKAVDAILTHFKVKATTRNLRMAEIRKDQRIARSLIEHGADINGREDLAGGDGLRPLHSAVGTADVPYIKFLVERGADVNARDAIGRTPLMVLAHDMERMRMDDEEADGMKAMQALIDLGADASAADNSGNDAIDHYRFELARSKEKPDAKVVKLLTKAGAKGSLPTFELFVAVAGDDVKRVRKAIASNADVNRIGPPHWESTALTMVASKGNVEIAQALIDAGADVNKPARSSLPLVTAADRGHLAIVKLLIEAGAEIHALEPQSDPDIVPNNALMAARESGHDDIVKYLRSLGASKPKQGKWKPFAAGVGSWNDFSEMLAKAEPEVVARALAKMIDGKSETNAYGMTFQVGKRAYVVARPKGMRWSNVFQVAPPRDRFGEQKKVTRFAKDLAAATREQILVIEYSDTSDAASIERFQADGTSGREEGIDRDILQDMVDAVGDEAPEWAKQKLAETDEDEPSSTQRVEALAEQEKFVVAAYGFYAEPRSELDLEVRGYPADAFDAVYWVSGRKG